MKSLRFIDRRVGFSFGAILMMLGMIMPAALPTFASAASLLTGRSIQMSNSTASASAVTYKLTFTPSVAITTGGGFYVDFCAESPIIGSSTCTVPTAMTTTTAVLGTVSSAGSLTATTNGRLKFTGSATIPAASDSYEFTTITNTSTVGTFYARVYTYTSANLASYTNPGSIGTAQDAGGIALSATNAIGIAATVQETMTFCTTTATPTANCANSAALNLTLGTGTPSVLGTTTQTAGGYMELSTNAVSGAQVTMTNSNNCGGLRRVTAGASTCDIAPTNTSNALTGGDGKFGLNVGASATVGGTGSGSVTALAPYSTTNQYGMTYTGVGTGVSSTYGDPIANTASNPSSNAYAPITFAANASNTTPAGYYQATMNLVATGTF